MGFSGSSDSKESVCNVEDLGSIPKLGRSPGEVNQIPTPVFWPGKFHRLYSPWGLKELDMTEQLSLSPITTRMLSSSKFWLYPG